MRRETVAFLCGICGDGTGPVANDVGDDEDDTQLPAGWLQVLARRAVPNPAYRGVEGHLDSLMQVALAAVDPNGPQPSDDDIQGLRGQLRHEATKMSLLDDTPSMAIESVELTLCPACLANEGALADLVALDEEAFVDAGWDIPAEPELVPAPVEGEEAAHVAG